MMSIYLFVDKSSVACSLADEGRLDDIPSDGASSRFYRDLGIMPEPLALGLARMLGAP